MINTSWFGSVCSDRRDLLLVLLFINRGNLQGLHRLITICGITPKQVWMRRALSGHQEGEAEADWQIIGCFHLIFTTMSSALFTFSKDAHQHRQMYMQNVSSHIAILWIDYVFLCKEMFYWKSYQMFQKCYLSLFLFINQNQLFCLNNCHPEGS